MLNAFLAGKKLLCGDYTQYTPAGKAYFMKIGRWGKEPRLGAVVYFYSKNIGRVAHVGTVVDVKKQGSRYTIKTSEGNTSAGAGFNRNGGCVAIKEYTFTLDEVGDKNRINGFGYPQFDEDTCTVEDFITVLKAEVGYIEKASNNELESKTANAGDKNYTKYGKWYKESCGGDCPAYWCQQFVSWCAYTACKAHREQLQTGWIKISGRWQYRLCGHLVKSQWLEIDNRWYVFDAAGQMITGWFKQGEDWYYMNPADGAMLLGQWVNVDGKSYYLSKNGVMAKSCYVKDETTSTYCWINSNGVYDKEYDTLTPELSKYEIVC